jgi:multidrug efflux pump
MLARFFIDRPIFAWVISIVIVLAGGVAVVLLPIAQYPEITPPSVQVTCNYAGASALVVADTVAAPIEQQVNGVENMLYMSSQATNDGTYNLTVTFELGTDLNMAQVLVQNRVSQALPTLPDVVKATGVTVKKKSPSILLVVNLVSDVDKATGQPYLDQLYLSNYATIQVRDELSRIKGVGDVSLLGQQDYSMRLWVDPERLANRNLQAGDVVRVVKEQNVQVPAGQVGQPPIPKGQDFQYTLTTQGRLEDAGQFGDIVLKVGEDGEIVRMWDVVRDTTYRIYLDPAKLAKYKLKQEDVAAALRNGPLESRFDATADRAGAVVARIRSQRESRKKLDDIKIPVPGADPVPLKDLAAEVIEEPGIELGARNQDVRCRLDGQPSVGLAIFQLPGSNALDVGDAIKKKMEKLAAAFPQHLRKDIVYDTTPFVKESVIEVFHTLRDAVILVAIVVLLFLQDWKSVILPLIDVAVSLVGTFAVMLALGFSLNNLTLFGLVLAIGIVVDDAIVVLENIEVWLAKGFPVREATINAMNEITGPIIAITLVLSSVFLPSAFLGGITGQFYRQFALTIATSMIISAINAMTMTPARAAAVFGHRTHEPGGHSGGHEALPWWGITIIAGALVAWLVGPMVAERILPHAEEGQLDIRFYAICVTLGLPAALIGWALSRKTNRVLAILFGWFNRGFDAITRVYGKIVGGMLHAYVIVLIVYVGLIGLTGWMFNRVPTGFIPEQDKGYLVVNIQLPDSASLERTMEVARHVEEIAQATPGVAHTNSIPGMSFILNSAVSSNFASMFIVLEPFEKRHHDHEKTAPYVAKKVRDRVRNEIEEAVVLVFGAPAVDGLGNAGGFKLMVEDRGSRGLAMLQGQADNLADQANRIPGLVGVFNSFRSNTPQLYVDIDRVQCKSQGVALNDLFDTLQVFLGGYYVNDFNRFGRTWQVNVQADASYRITADVVRQLKVRNAAGQMVPLGAVATIKDAGGPVMVTRYNMYPAATVNGGSLPGVSTGTVISEMEALAKRELAENMEIEWTELTYMQKLASQFESLRDLRQNPFVAFAGAVLLVFLVLAAQYESWSVPLAVILVMPMCLLCAVLGVAFAEMDINIFVQIGFVVLVGMAAKNAILIVAFARDRRQEGMSLFDATVQASTARLRPIIMTSFAFILGVVPLVLASGAGAEMRRTLGTAVFAGMLGVTAFGIFLTPMFYYVIMRWTAGAGPAAAPPNVPHS